MVLLLGTFYKTSTTIPKNSKFGFCVTLLAKFQAWVEKFPAQESGLSLLESGFSLLDQALLVDRLG